MSIERLLDTADSAVDPVDLYGHLRFPDPPSDRPYTYVNMVSTVDGKILIGPRGSTAKGVGGPTDQILMRRLEENAECALIGAGTLRPGNVIYPNGMWRAVVTRSGDVPLENRFFTDAPDRAIVFAPESLPSERRAAVETRALLRLAGSESVDVKGVARILRQEFGIRRLLVEGGAELNSELFLNGLVDEFFITIAPKVKGGAKLPTPVEGPGFPDRQYAPLSLVSIYRDGDELYLRYRVGAKMSG